MSTSETGPYYKIIPGCSRTDYVSKIGFELSVSVSNAGVKGMCHYNAWPSFLSSGNTVNDSEVLILLIFYVAHLFSVSPPPQGVM